MKKTVFLLTFAFLYASQTLISQAVAGTPTPKPTPTPSMGTPAPTASQSPHPLSVKPGDTNTRAMTKLEMLDFAKTMHGRTAKKDWSCEIARANFKKISGPYYAKLNLCNDADASKKKSDELRSTYWWLFDYIFKGEPACKDCAEKMQTQVEKEQQAADDDFWKKWEECHFGDGPSLGALKFVYDAAVDLACEKCHGNVNEAGDPIDQSSPLQGLLHDLCSNF